MHKSHSLLISLVLLGAFACGQSSFDQKLSNLYEGSVPTITPDSLNKLLEASQILLLDVRSPKEYQVSHISGSQFFDYKTADLSVIKIQKDQPIILYCTVGYRSERIGEKLQKLGYSNVSNLYGGIIGWKNNQFEVINAQGPTEKVHTYNASWSRWLLNGEKIYD